MANLKKSNAPAKQHRTYQTRIKTDSSVLFDVLDSYAEQYGKIERKLYAETLAKGTRPESVKSFYQKRFQITARQFNAICRNLKGKVQSINELQKDYIAEGQQRIKKAEKVIDRLIKKIERAPQAVDIKKRKFQLHQKKRRLAILKQRQAHRIQDQESGNVRLCFGSKKLFHAQFNLEKAGFSDHSEWLDAWQSKRSSQLYVLGSKDETAGCQGCVARVTESGFVLKLRLLNSMTEKFGKYIEIPIELPYGDDVLRDALIDGCAINYRFLRDDKGWRVFVTTAVTQKKPTSDKNIGAIGVDVNADHLAVCEIDRYGNPVDRLKIPLCTYGKSADQAKAVIGDATKQLMDFAENKQKPIVVEKLDFRKKKAELEKQDTKYSRMLSSFSYNKIIGNIKARAYDSGIDVIERNPAYTSVIGKAKFTKRYGLSTHQAAACAIARRSLNFSEKPNRSDQLAALLPARNRTVHVWSFWRKASRILAGHEARQALGITDNAQSTLPQTIAATCDPSLNHW